MSDAHHDPSQPLPLDGGSSTETPALPLPVPTRWGALTVSIYALTLLLISLFAAIMLHNDSMLNIVAGAIVANAGAVVQFWVGSSHSSQTKDETIASQLPAQPTTNTRGSVS